mmetsp:Transcript_9206/g.22610  ORF Transcript_9206/g.22610 Transcript_9206/m.22610 type:complete len:569 (-) Transcript_9206:264-1970(-)
MQQQQQQLPPSQATGGAGGAATPGAASSGPSVYYVMLDDGRSMMHPKRLASQLESGEISGETMIWADGFSAWKKVSEVQEFKALLPDDDPTVSAAAAMRQQEKGHKWFYLHPTTKAQEGPFELAVIRSLISHGTINQDTLLWHQEMGEQWLPAKEITDIEEEFTGAAKGDKKLASSSGSPVGSQNWFYTDKYRQQQGPVPDSKLAKLLEEKEITGDSLVWKEGVGDWKPINAVPELASLLLNAMLPPEARAKIEAGKDGTKPGAGKSGGKPNDTKETKSNEGQDEKVGQKRKRKKKKKKGWKKFDNAPHVYVQGLPKDITVDEIHEHFKKAGRIAKNIDNTPRIKIYKDKDGNVKGDGLVTYLFVESVPMAIQFLHEEDIKPGHKLTVQKAEFSQKGEKFVEKKIKKTDVKFKKFQQAQGAGWDDDGIREIKGFRIVILKYMFTQDEAGKGIEQREKFFEDLKLEVGTEIESKCGEIEKLTVFEYNPDGVIAVKFKQGTSAAKCIEIMHGRYFGQRKLECFYFDGKTNYKVGETEEIKNQREKEYTQWMMEGESEGANDSGDTNKSTA